MLIRKAFWMIHYAFSIALSTIMLRANTKLQNIFDKSDI